MELSYVFGSLHFRNGDEKGSMILGMIEYET